MIRVGILTLRDRGAAGEYEDRSGPVIRELVVERLGELVEDGSWRSVFDDLGQYQRQLRTLLFYGLLSRKEETDS